MKKVLFIVAGLLFMATVTFAQDTTRTQQQSPEQTPTQSYTKDMVKITATDLPEAVRQTLAAPQYQGWESAPVYRSKNNDMYIIEMGTGDQAKTFRFGADGKPILE
ncbi:MAG TPA: hypothetical protein VK658_20600 [Chryseolinea sp.]|nr:hypothetical protein [Chryseolinea sp.]